MVAPRGARAPPGDNFCPTGSIFPNNSPKHRSVPFPYASLLGWHHGALNQPPLQTTAGQSLAALHAASSMRANPVSSRVQRLLLDRTFQTTAPATQPARPASAPSGANISRRRAPPASRAAPLQSGSRSPEKTAVHPSPPLQEREMKSAGAGGAAEAGAGRGGGVGRSGGSRRSGRALSATRTRMRERRWKPLHSLLALSQFIWAHRFGEPVPFPAPKLMDLYRTPNA